MISRKTAVLLSRMRALPGVRITLEYDNTDTFAQPAWCELKVWGTDDDVGLTYNAREATFDEAVEAVASEYKETHLMPLPPAPRKALMHGDGE